jgi:glutamine amidotransferase
MSFDIAIIAAVGANFTSIQAALKRQKVSSIVTNDPSVIVNAKGVILPGVGNAKYAMSEIYNQGLNDVIKSLTQPVLGICLGQQLLCSFSEEGDVPCLDIIPLRVARIQNVRVVPHNGWNSLKQIKNDSLLFGIDKHDDFYFVHSFAPLATADYTVATCAYGNEFAAIIKKDNFYGVQFHPEKSGDVGERLLMNFINKL